MHRVLALAAAAFLIAAPISFAQTTPAPEQPAATPAPSAAPAPAAPAAAAPSTTSAPVAAPAAAADAAPANQSAPQGCRTRKDAGEPCACLSDTSRVGVSTPSAAGHNVCVRPD